MKIFFKACDLPFGVRILNAFLTLTEYRHLYDALAESAYRQPSSSHSSGTFPDLYATSSSGTRGSSGRQIDKSDDKHLSHPTPQFTSGNRGTDSPECLGSTGQEGNSTENLARVVASAMPVGTSEDTEQHTDDNSDIADGRESKSKPQCKTESSTPLGVEPSIVEHTLSDEKDMDSVTTIEGREDRTEKENENNETESCVFAENRDEEDGREKNEDSTTDFTEVENSSAVFDSSSCESELSNDVNLAMEAIDVAGLKIVEYSSSQCQGQQCGEAEGECEPGTSSTGSLCNDSLCATSESSGTDDIDICSLVLEDLIRKVVDKENFDLNMEGSESVLGFAACCEAYAKKSCYCSDGLAKPCESRENTCQAQSNKSLTNTDNRSVEHDLRKEKVDFPRDFQETDPCQSHRSNGEETSCKTSPNNADFVKNDTNPNSENVLINHLTRTPLVSNESFSNENSRSAEHDLEKETMDIPADNHATDALKSDRSSGEEASCGESPRTANVAENCLPIEANPDKENSSRSELTPIVCDSFSIRNLNVGSEKLLEKSFACMDSFADAEIPECEVNVSTPPSNANGSTRNADATASLISAESDSEVFVANGQESIASSGGLEVPVDQALEEVEFEKESWEWFEPPLGDIHTSSLADLEGEEELPFEEEGGGEGVNQVSTSFKVIPSK